MPRLLAALIALLALAGCISHEPRFRLPERTEADCESRSVKQTAIEAIVASVDDAVQAGVPYPGDAQERALIKSLGGTFAFWDNDGGQRVRLPNTAKTLGAEGEYLMLTRAVITNDVNEREHSRPIWLTFATPSGPKTVREKAYDTQNVCIEGRRES